MPFSAVRRRYCELYAGDWLQYKEGPVVANETKRNGKEIKRNGFKQASAIAYTSGAHFVSGFNNILKQQK